MRIIDPATLVKAMMDQLPIQAEPRRDSRPPTESGCQRSSLPQSNRYTLCQSWGPWRHWYPGA